jgi:hypothetical protein
MFHQLLITSRLTDILTRAIYCYPFVYGITVFFLGFCPIFVYRQLNAEHANPSIGLFPTRFWLLFTGSVAYSIQEHMGAYSMWELCASCVGVSRYQLVRCGWGATLPATLYPAIYMWPTAIYLLVQSRQSITFQQLLLK